LLNRYQTRYEGEDLEDYFAVLQPLEPLSLEEFKRVSLAWQGDAHNRRAPYPGELKQLLAHQRQQARQPQALESWQQPPPPPEACFQSPQERRAFIQEHCKLRLW
jgi:hypothetical protein